MSEILTLQVKDQSPEQFGCIGPEMFDLRLYLYIITLQMVMKFKRLDLQRKMEKKRKGRDGYQGILRT